MDANLLFTGSLPKYLQQMGLGQTSQELHPELPSTGLGHQLLSPRMCLSRKLAQKYKWDLTLDTVRGCRQQSSMCY